MKKKVISIEELAEMKEHCAVLISSVYCEEIMELLEKSGISNIFVTHKDVFGQPKS